MIFGIVQVALGALLIAAPFVLGGAAWVLPWPGISVLVVGLGYLGLGSRVFGKRAHDGGHSLFLIVLLFPYVAIAWTIWQLKSRLRAEAPWHEIAPGVRLGRRPLDLSELPPDTRCLVDLTSELPRALPTAALARYVCLPTLDTGVAPDRDLAALVESLVPDEGPLYIHCAMGHGRSATVAAALLIRRGLAADVDSAVAALRKIRPSVHLHAAQRAAVMRLAAAAGRIAGP